MSERMKETREMLARHHRDGERFARMMKESFERRFDEAFWSDWEHWVVPAYSEEPVILDLGAGPGMFIKAAAERYPSAHVFGVECAPYMLDAAETLPENGKLLCEDLHEPSFPFEESSVDAAIASVVLHEMNQPVRALQELARCLRPGGRLLILDWVRAPLEVYVREQTDEARVFDRDTPVDELEDLFVHFVEHNRFSREDLCYLLQRTGFAVIDSTVTREGRFGRIVAERR